MVSEPAELHIGTLKKIFIFIVGQTVFNKMGGIKRRSYYHSLLTSTDAEAILQGKEPNSFLLRRNIYKDIIISYKCKRKLIKHIRLPKIKNNNIMQNTKVYIFSEIFLNFFSFLKKSL